MLCNSIREISNPGSRNSYYLVRVIRNVDLSSKSFIFAYKLDNMVTTIKKGTSREKIIDALSKRKVKIKGPDLQAWCGSISLKEDPLDLQKKWRNEWE